MSGGRDLYQAGLLLIDAAVVDAGTAVALLLNVSAWSAVPVGLAAYLGLYAAALAILLRGRHRRGPA
jgi:hypothetical protein